MINTWIARFGVPARITTDQGRQFESHLFKELSCTLGIDHLRTNAYHPQANGIIERWHRTLKAAIMCNDPVNWSDRLPVILLGLRSAFKADIQTTAAQMVYGTTLRLPGEFFINNTDSEPQSEFVKNLSTAMRKIQPSETAHHSSKKPFICKALLNSVYVFVRIDAVRPALKPPYDGPYKVINKNDKFYTIEINKKNVNISIDRLKPAFMEATPEDGVEVSLQPQEEICKKTRSVPVF